MKNGTPSPSTILLYRFMAAEHGMPTIATRTFRVGRISALNDPFEWRVGITGIVSMGEDVARQCLNDFVNEMNQSIGIVCYSKSFREPVLWAHYAKNHTGLAFEIEYPRADGALQHVKYKKTRPTVDANRLAEGTADDAYLRPRLRAALTQKSTGWRYEQECRVYHSLPNCERRGDSYFTPIPDTRRRVILGYDCPLVEADVKHALQEAGLPNTSVARAKVDHRTYTIRC